MLALLLFACAFEPLYGSWTYAQTTVDLDSCGLGDQLEATSATVFVEASEEGGLRITDPEGYAFDCALDDMAFTCPDRWPERIYLNDTELSAVGEAHGSFDTESVARGSQSVTLDCVDLSCEAGAAFLGIDPPCDLEVSFLLTKAE